MKKLILLMIVLLLATTVNAIGPEIEMSILRYEPAPAEQGNTFDIWLQLSNTGTQADNVVIKFVPEFPFSLPLGAREDLVVGTIAAIEEKVVKFSIFVDSNAPNGDKNIKFQYKTSESPQWTLFESPISIETQDAGLVIEDYTVAPSTIIPGQTVTIDLLIRNAGKIGVKNIDVDLGVQENHFSTIGS